MIFKKPQIEHICKNCRLYDPKSSKCQVVILHEGERLKILVEEQDACFFEEEYFDPTTKAMESYSEDIKEVKFWVENEKGEKTKGDGVVKIEYPEGYFGSDADEPLYGDK